MCAVRCFAFGARQDVLDTQGLVTGPQCCTLFSVWLLGSARALETFWQRRLTPRTPTLCLAERSHWWAAAFLGQLLRAARTCTATCPATCSRLLPATCTATCTRACCQPLAPELAAQRLARPLTQPEHAAQGLAQQDGQGAEEEGDKRATPRQQQRAQEQKKKEEKANNKKKEEKGNKKEEEEHEHLHWHRSARQAWSWGGETSWGRKSSTLVAKRVSYLAPAVVQVHHFTGYHSLFLIKMPVIRPTRDSYRDYGPETEDLGQVTSKVPPGWNGHNVPYKKWRKKVSRWATTTEIKEEKIAGTVAQRLYGAPGRFAEALDDAKLAQKDGLRHLLTQLDAHYGEVKADEAYKDFRKFIGRRRRKGEAIRDFIAEWETFREEAEAHEFVFTGGIDAYLLVDAMGLTDEELSRMLAILNGKLEYQAAKQYLTRTDIGDIAGTYFNAADPDTEYSEEDDDPFLVHYQFDVADNDREEFEHVYQNFVRARRALNQFRPARRYKYRPSLTRRRMFSAQSRSSGSQPGSYAPARQVYPGAKVNYGEEYYDYNDELQEAEMVHTLSTEDRIAYFVGKGRFKGSGRGKGSLQKGDRQINPMGPDGKRMLCHLCGSDRHFQAECPKAMGGGMPSSAHLADANQGTQAEAASRARSGAMPAAQAPDVHPQFFHEIFMMQVHEVEVEHDAHVMMHECMHLVEEYECALTLDIGATSNLVGSEWVKSYKKRMPKDMVDSIVTSPCQRSFKFANDNKVTLSHVHRFPIVLQDEHGQLTHAYYQAHVIDGECPALWALPSIKQLGGSVDTTADKLSFPTWPGAPCFVLRYTKKGHYVLPSLPGPWHSGPAKVFAVGEASSPSSSAAAAGHTGPSEPPVAEVAAEPMPPDLAMGRPPLKVDFGTPLLLTDEDVERLKSMFLKVHKRLMEVIKPGHFVVGHSVPGTSSNIATKLLEILEIGEADVGVGRGLEYIPKDHKKIAEHRAGILLLWDAEKEDQIRLLGRRVDLDGEPLWLRQEGILDQYIVVFLFCNKGIDHDRQEELKEATEALVQPNLKSLTVLQDGSPAQVRRELVRMHVRLRHIPAHRFSVILKQAGYVGKILNWSRYVDKWCKACQQHAPRPLEPKVSLSMVTEFGQLVGMDTVYFEDTMWLHMVDYMSRLSSVQLLVNREPATCIQAVEEAWVRFFGLPRAIRTDRDGSFDNLRFRTWADVNGVVVQFVATEAHSSAGVVERHNRILKEVAKRLRTDGIPAQRALLHAAAAKNEGLQVDGYCPFQLAFGWKPRRWDQLISGELDFPPGDRSARASGIEVLENAIMERAAAAKHFQQAMVSSELRRAMTHNRKAGYLPHVGDQVDFYRKPSIKEAPGWRGPAVVIDVQKDRNLCHLRWHDSITTSALDALRQHVEALHVEENWDMGRNIHKNKPAEESKPNANLVDLLSTSQLFYILGSSQSPGKEESEINPSQTCLMSHDFYGQDLDIYSVAVSSATLKAAADLPEQDSIDAEKINENHVFVCIITTKQSNRQKVDVMEVFSGTARLTKVANDMGFLTADPVDYRTGWNLRLKEHQQRLFALISMLEPLLVAMAPNCGPWSIAHTRNLVRREQLREQERPVIKLVSDIGTLQDEQARLWLLEQPDTSAMWAEEGLQPLLTRPTTCTIRGSMCCYNLRDAITGLLIRKNFRLAANNPDLLAFCNKLCQGDHEHQQLVGSVGSQPRTRTAGAYPAQFCRAVMMGLQRAMLSTGRSQQHQRDVLHTCRGEQVISTAELSEAQRNHLSFVMGTLLRLPEGRYKQYGPLWQGGRASVVMSAGGRKNPVLLAKALNLGASMFMTSQFVGVVLYRSMPILPPILGARRETAALVVRPDSSQLIKVKADSSRDTNVSTFGPKLHVIRFYSMPTEMQEFDDDNYTQDWISQVPLSLPLGIEDKATPFEWPDLPLASAPPDAGQDDMGSKTPPTMAQQALREMDNFQTPQGTDTSVAEDEEFSPISEDLHVEEAFATIKELDNLSKADQEKYADLVLEAKLKELQSWADFGVYELVPSVLARGHEQLQYLWVLRWKALTADETAERIKAGVQGEGLRRKVKARLTIRGDQDTQKHWLETEAPTASRTSQRLVWHTAVQQEWPVQSWDVTAAFLRASAYATHERPLFMIPPPEIAVPGKLMRLLKPAYGLAEAPLRWARRLADVLRANGWRSHLVPCLWARQTAGGRMIMTTHVDDLQVTGPPQELEHARQQLEKDLGSMTPQTQQFVHVGLEVSQNQQTMEITVSQLRFAGSMEPINVAPPRRRQKDSPVTPDELRQLRAKVGSLAWLSTNTRVDIAAEVSILQSATAHATVSTLLECNRLVALVQAQPLSLHFAKLKPPLRIEAIGDSGFRADVPGRPRQGAVVRIAGAEQELGGRGHLMAWRSGLAKRAVRSTLGAELLAQAETINIATRIRYEAAVAGAEPPALAQAENWLHSQHKMVTVTDCSDLWSLVQGVGTPTESNLLPDLVQIRELAQLGYISGSYWCPTTSMVADGLTKCHESLKPALTQLAAGHWMPEGYKLAPSQTMQQ